MKHRLILLLSCLVTGAPSTAWAQDAGQWGVVVAAPGSAGVLWQLSDRWAIRGDVDYHYSKNVFETGGASFTFNNEVVQAGGTTSRSESSTHSAGVGLSALVTVHRTDALRLYLAPRIAVNFASTLSESTVATTLPPGIPADVIRGLVRSQTVEDSSATPAGGVSFGASTTIGTRFGVFGEAGVLYSRHESSPSATVASTSIGLSTMKRTGFGTTGRVGVMLLF
jgi:hypothetical protein